MLLKNSLMAFPALLFLVAHIASADSNLIKYDVESWLDQAIVGYADQTDMAPPDFCHFLKESNPTTKPSGQSV